MPDISLIDLRLHSEAHKACSCLDSVRGLHSEAHKAYSCLGSASCSQINFDHASYALSLNKWGPIGKAWDPFY